MVCQYGWRHHNRNSIGNQWRWSESNRMWDGCFIARTHEGECIKETTVASVALSLLFWCVSQSLWDSTSHHHHRWWGVKSVRCFWVWTMKLRTVDSWAVHLFYISYSLFSLSKWEISGKYAVSQKHKIYTLNELRKHEVILHNNKNCSHSHRIKWGSESYCYFI